MPLSRDEMLSWIKPDVPGAVVWQSDYHWIGLGQRSTIHGPEEIEDVVRSLAVNHVVYFDVYPLDKNGERINPA